MNKLIIDVHSMPSIMQKGLDTNVNDQIRVTNITTLFILPLTFKTHFWSEVLTIQLILTRYGICVNSILSISIDACT